ncbi:hypothetical protein AciX8_2599 [Granulicella mallensis MP5ACTX8]|uniref:Uncharacterized protein n=1 Tax=Granulicella mallensis (strain ATCC BAA-1857 / DSM 23137 / MP5ACTX8) TaxID=682795 RepID=G8P0B5_GRAMM|nr:hypothetical protein AciX8_2599 [Granulicella mallensis MP5ACTX8]
MCFGHSIMCYFDCDFPNGITFSVHPSNPHLTGISVLLFIHDKFTVGSGDHMSDPENPSNRMRKPPLDQWGLFTFMYKNRYILQTFPEVSLK